MTICFWHPRDKALYSDRTCTGDCYTFELNKQKVVATHGKVSVFATAGGLEHVATFNASKSSQRGEKLQDGADLMAMELRLEANELSLHTYVSSVNPIDLPIDQFYAVGRDTYCYGAKLLYDNTTMTGDEIIRSLHKMGGVSEKCDVMSQEMLIYEANYMLPMSRLPVRPPPAPAPAPAPTPRDTDWELSQVERAISHGHKFDHSTGQRIDMSDTNGRLSLGHIAEDLALVAIEADTIIAGVDVGDAE